MKPVLIIFFILFIAAFYTSCKKELSCENCAAGSINNPPVAIAGPDLTILLPTDSIRLDGSASHDPDGTIRSFQWIKISGPASFNILSTDSSKTNVRSLQMGVYKFELKVTDNGGLSAKDTIQVIVDDPAINQPPVANAGNDQTIILPTDTASLNGALSMDPDGTIVSYQWSKISGPSNFTIINNQSAVTIADNLVQGTYLFEIKVTDNGGLFSRDTVQVRINSPVPPQTGCNMTMDIVAHLPTPGSVGYAVSTGSKMLFTRIGSSNQINIYDTLTHNWETVSGMEAIQYFSASSKAAVVSDKIIFYAPTNVPAQDQVINLYDASSNSWSINHLPGRGRSFYAMTVVGNKAVFAGGEGQDSNIAKTIDIYDATTNTWSLLNFNNGRRGMVAASVGNKVLFAGGYINRYDSLVLICDDYGNNCDSIPATVPSGRVDIWNTASNTWSIAQLSIPRNLTVAAVVGNKILFAGVLDGGIDSSKVDIYDAVNNSWSAYTLPPSSWYGPCLAYTVGDKVLICNWISDRIDIYNASLNSWSAVHMSEPLIGEQHQFGQVATADNKIVFFLQYNTNESNSRNIDIYDALSETWCHTQLNQLMIRQGILAIGNRICVAGGSGSSSIYHPFDTPLDNVWFLDY